MLSLTLTPVCQLCIMPSIVHLVLVIESSTSTGVEVRGEFLLAAVRAENHIPLRRHTGRAVKGGAVYRFIIEQRSNIHTFSWREVLCVCVCVAAATVTKNTRQKYTSARGMLIQP